MRYVRIVSVTRLGRIFPPVILAIVSQLTLAKQRRSIILTP
jgi:hypothetical protein